VIILKLSPICGAIYTLVIYLSILSLVNKLDPIIFNSPKGCNHAKKKKRIQDQNFKNKNFEFWINIIYTAQTQKEVVVKVDA